MSNFDCVVIGGGLSGLYAAMTLRDRGFNVVVLEARERVGGRTHSVQPLGMKEYLDVGGQWIGGTHNRMRALCQKFSVQLFPQFEEGRHVLEVEGKVIPYSGNISTLNSNGSLDGLDEAVAKLDAMALTLDPAAPAAAPNAKEWDRMNCAEWLEKNVPAYGSRFILVWFITVCFAADPHEISLLQYLHFLRAAGGYAKLADIKGGAQQDRILGGSQTVSNKMAAALGPSVVRLYHTVTAVDMDRSTDADFPLAVTALVVPRSPPKFRDAKLVTPPPLPGPAGSQVRLRARHVINTLPSPLYRTIRFTPALPTPLRQLGDRAFMGSVLKTLTVYSTPWWRELGMSGEVISDRGPLALCYDDSADPKLNNGEQLWALVGFIAGAAAREWSHKSDVERRQGVIECYARFFSDKRALQPLAYIDKYWAEEELSGGCYFALQPPGSLTSGGANTTTVLHAPLDGPWEKRIHLAGCETASEWMGYMEGAVESGERAANEVSAALLPRPKL